MFGRLTDRSRKAMALANQHAQRLNNTHIGPEHILLGLIDEPSGAAVQILRNSGMDLRRLRVEVETQSETGTNGLTWSPLPQTPAGKKVIQHAIEESRDLGHSHVDTEHFLLGLLRMPDTSVQRTLARFGLTYDRCRQAIAATSRPADSRDGGPPGPNQPAG